MNNCDVNEEKRQEAGREIINRIKNRLDLSIKMVEFEDLFPKKNRLLLEERTSSLRRLLCSANIDKMKLLSDFIDRGYLGIEKVICIYCGFTEHSTDCLYKQILDWYDELRDLGFEPSPDDYRNNVKDGRYGDHYENKITDVQEENQQNSLNKVRDKKLDIFGLENLENVKADSLLNSFSKLFKTKNAEHGDAYKKIGYVLENLLPNGITLKTHHDFNKFTTLVQMLYKITRMCNTCFEEKELVHDSVYDSPRDLSVYAAIFCELLIGETLKKNEVQ